MRHKYIAVCYGRAFSSVKEPSGWIFRDLTNSNFGFNGHHRTLSHLIKDTLSFGAIIVDMDDNIVDKNTIVE